MPNLNDQMKKYQFIEMQVKKQMYMGKPVIALYMRDKTQRVYEQLLTMKRNEEIQTQTQVESFTSTISHEMNTPILTLIIFIKQMIIMLEGAPFDL